MTETAENLRRLRRIRGKLAIGIYSGPPPCCCGVVSEMESWLWVSTDQNLHFISGATDGQGEALHCQAWDYLNGCLRDLPDLDRTDS